MSVSFDGETECSCEAKVSKLDLGACGVDQEILGLQISVENTMLMEVNESMEDLEQETLCLFLG